MKKKGKKPCPETQYPVDKNVEPTPKKRRRLRPKKL